MAAYQMVPVMELRVGEQFFYRSTVRHVSSSRHEIVEIDDSLPTMITFVTMCGGVRQIINLPATEKVQRA